MSRIPDHEIERLKREVSIVRLVESAGIELRRHGKDLVGRCPWHSPDRTPSLVITLKSNLWHCMGACRVGGSVFDWVMRLEGLSFRQAFDRLRQVNGDAPWVDEMAHERVERSRARHSNTGEAAALPLSVVGGQWSEEVEPAASNPSLVAASDGDAEERASDANAAPSIGAASSVAAARPTKRQVDAEFAARFMAAAGDQALMSCVVDYYHATLLATDAARLYLDKRGICLMEAVRHFRLGYANRTLAYLLPSMQVKAGAKVRGALQRLGVLRESGHEHLNGSLVVPVIAPAFACADGSAASGVVLELYGRKLLDNLRAGTPKHLYLPECVSASLGKMASTPEIVRYRGVFNEAGIEREEEVIVCEALIDALTFWCAGFRNVTTSYGVNGFTDELLAALLRFKTKRVLIAYDNDAAGNSAAATLAAKLLGLGIECYRVLFPKGMDANEYACAVKPAMKALSVAVRQAEWMGKAAAPPLSAPGAEQSPQRPTSRSIDEFVPENVGDVPAQVARLAAEQGEAIASDGATTAQNEAERVAAAPRIAQAAVGENVAASVPVALAIASEEKAPLLPAAPAASVQVRIEANVAARVEANAPQPSAAQPAAHTPPAYRVAPSAPPLPVEVADNGELRLVLGDRAYRVRGIEQNTSDQVLKVWLKVERGDGFHLDTVDLAHDKQRGAWIKRASVELGVSEDVARSDLGKVLRACEERQSALIRERLEKSKKPAGDGVIDGAAQLSEEQREAGLALLRDPNLIERIVADVEATGVVGEASNALVAYLACVSRKLDKPLAILIQSTSAAGKSTLMDAVLALMPEAERVQYSAMTGQSLFYLGETSMQHKVLAIAEEEGVRQAAYALKLLQSQGELTIASTGKDPITGQMVTQEYRVQGPVMLFLTTTAIDIDEELLNRCLVLTINESREQTAAIQARQRSSRTLNGLLAKTKADGVLAAHRAAQALLRPLAVVNPFAEQLTFASDRVRLRRDHQKYLALIDSIALLHQHQRPVRTVAHGGKVVEYIEATREDIALANRLAHEVLGRSLDELPPQTRRVLGQVAAFVDTRARELRIERGAVRFSRREAREWLSVSEKQARVHLDRLLDLEYLIAHSGRHGQRFFYELAFDGDIGSDTPHAMGLVDLATSGNANQRQGTTSDFVGHGVNFVVSGENLVPRSCPDSGPFVAGSCSQEIAVPASVGAAIPYLVAAVAGNALPEPPREASHRNGASYAGAQR
jgi:DNA primase/post-segregation antitoxin (ccd killing protein)